MAEGAPLAPKEGAQPLKNIGSLQPLLTATTPANTNWSFAPATGKPRVVVADARRLMLYVKIDGGGGVSAQDVRIVPLLSASDTEPAAGDDSWYAPAVYDGTVTAEALGGGTVPTGADWSKSPEWGKVVARPLTLAGEPLDNATDKVRVVYTVDVTGAKWFQIAYADVSAAATKATITIDYVLAI